MLLRFLRATSLALLSFAAPHIRAQSAPTDSPAPAPLLRSDSRAVVVDVVVSRGKDEPVLGLRPQDFQVLEDGKPQAVNFFEENSASVAPASLPPAQPPNVFSNAPVSAPGSAITVLLLDGLNTPAQDQQSVHKQLVSFVHSLQPGQRVAVFTLNARLHLVQDFTADGALLMAAIESKSGAPRTNPASRTRDDDLRDKEELSILGEMSNTGGADSGLSVRSNAESLAERSRVQAGQRSSLTLAALQQLARALGGIPGRKDLIWVATNFPVSMFPDGPVKQTLSNGGEIESAVRETVNLLNLSQISIYPVSAQGIQVDHTTNADSGGQPEGDNFERSPLQELPSLSANRSAMERLATDTGGAASYTTNNLSQAMARAVQDGLHYYTLAYTPASTHEDGKFHRIEVQLAGEKARLSYRRGYYADVSPDSKPQPDPLPALMAPGMPGSTQILYQARIVAVSPQPASDAPRAGGNAKLSGPITRYKVDFLIKASNLVLDAAADGQRAGKIEVALIAYDAAGKPVNWTGNTLALSLNAASFAQVQRTGIPIHLQMDLPRKEFSLATGVYDLNAKKAGTLEVSSTALNAAPTQ